MIRTAGLALLLAAGPAACDSSAPAKPETFDAGQEFTLAPGGTGVARDGGFEVRFISVSEDSRCPTDVTCVWAGEVKLKVALKARSEDAEREVKEGESTTFGGRELTAVLVRPRPVSTKKIAADEYRATFRVSASR
jgi:hypothetical protein